MADNVTPTKPAPEGPKNNWPKTALWMFVIGIIALNLSLVLRSCRNLPGETLDKTAKVIEKAGKTLTDIASAFRQGTITTEFFSYGTTLSNQQYFQFATLKQTEVFTRSEEARTGFGYIPLPAIVVEARAPVEYTYHLDLNGKWNFVLKDNVVHVLAPPIRFNRPAVDASAITYEVKKGYLKTEEALDNLKQSLTSLSMLKARENIPLVRENGRRQTAEFVERWLMKSFTDSKDYTVKVYFPGEKIPDGVALNNTPLP